jgi:type IV secretion system protein VirB5
MTLAFVEKKETETREGSPWLNAKNRHMDVYIAQSQSIAQWRIIALIMMLLLALSVGGNIYLSTAVKVQPFVVQVDEHGYAIPVQMAEVSGIDERVIAAHIGQFIINSRIRIGDKRAQIIFSENAYKSVGAGSNAASLLDRYFRDAPPTKSEKTVHVSLQAVIPLTPSTYQAEWSETTTSSDGKEIAVTYSGIFEIAVSPPKDMTNLVHNPLGIFVTDYHVQQKIK